MAVFFLGFFTFVALLEGFGIDHLKFGGVKVEKLYLKWDNALLIRASKIDLSDLKSDDKPFTLKPLGELPKIIRWSERWVESFHIDTIKYKEFGASLSYHKNHAGIFTLHHGQITCEGNFTLDEKRFCLTLPACRVNEGVLSGKLTLEIPDQHLRADATLSLPDTPLIRIHAAGDADTLRFSAQAENDFSTVAPLVRFFGVSPKVAPWIAEYAKASSLHLHRLEGSFAYDTPKKLLETLNASATVDMGEYTFAQGIAPITANRIDLLFWKGKLYITPQEGRFYTFPTEQSRLWIDFAVPHTTLTALIQTRHAQLNDPILNLLHHYRIDLPLKQTSGECAVDLNLTVDLHTLKTTAQGTFIPTPSELLLDRIALRSEGGIVRLDTMRVTFEDFIAHYGDNVAHARVNGEYDASTKQGQVSIDAYEVSPIDDRNHLSLSDPQDPLRITYNIAPGKSSLNVMPSSWNLLGEKLDVEGFSAPFDYHNASVSVHSVPFQISGSVQGQVSAHFDGSREVTDIALLLERFRLKEIALSNTPFRLNVHYSKDGTKIDSPAPSAWSVHNLPLLLSPFNALMKEDRIAFECSEAMMTDLLKGNISGEYRPGTRKGSVHLKDILPISPKYTPLIDTIASVDLSIDANGDTVRLDAPALKAHFSTIPEGWKISLDDISLLSKRSPLLRRYHIDKGYVNLFYTGERSLYSFNGAIDYPYSLMLINDRSLSEYRFNGSYQEGISTIRVNDRLVISHTPGQLYARANNAGINIPELFRFLSSFDESKSASASSDTNASLPIRIHGTNTYLYLMKGKKILAETLDATLHDNDIDATLRHGGGSASLAIQNGRFYIGGGGFNDIFMKHLFSLGDFSGGTLSFQAQGESDAFDGVIRVEKTVLKDYIVLNNVLAFINTVPSLATFSLPNYNTEGLPLEEGYAHFAYNKGIVKVDNFTLNSPEMKILGEGNADISARTLQGVLTLKTDLGSVLGKVPMVGYILFGNDGSISTTLTLSGKLEDPKVETSITQEIVTAPFNILKRTVIYPFLWMLPD